MLSTLIYVVYFVIGVQSSFIRFIRLFNKLIDYRKLQVSIKLRWNAFIIVQVRNIFFALFIIIRTLIFNEDILYHTYFVKKVRQK